MFYVRLSRETSRGVEILLRRAPLERARAAVIVDDWWLVKKILYTLFRNTVQQPQKHTHTDIVKKIKKKIKSKIQNKKLKHTKI